MTINEIKKELEPFQFENSECTKNSNILRQNNNFNIEGKQKESDEGVTKRNEKNIIKKKSIKSQETLIELGSEEKTTLNVDLAMKNEGLNAI